MKHEKAVLISLAYVIGFVTAFIAFSLSGPDKNIISDEIVATTEMASGNNDSTQPDNFAEIMDRIDGLYVMRDGNERVVSARDENISNQKGFHSRIFLASMSPDKTYMHYCAEVVKDANECINYVYSFTKDMVMTLKSANNSIVSAKAGPFPQWSGNANLELDGAVFSADNNWSID